MSHKEPKTGQGVFDPYDVDWSDGKTPVPGDGPRPAEPDGPATVSMGAVTPREVCTLCGAPLGTCTPARLIPTQGGVSVLDLKAWADAQPGTGVKMALVLPDTIPHEGDAEDGDE